MQVKSFEEAEHIIGCKIPKSIKYSDPTGPPRTHYAMLKNERTGKIIAHASHKRVRRSGPDNVQNTQHAEQELIREVERVKKHMTASEWRGQKTIISARFSRNGHIGNSKVCASCARLIKNKCKGYVKQVMYFSSEQEPLWLSIDDICKDASYSSGDVHRKDFIK